MKNKSSLIKNRISPFSLFLPPSDRSDKIFYCLHFFSFVALLAFYLPFFHDTLVGALLTTRKTRTSAPSLFINSSKAESVCGESTNNKTHASLRLFMLVLPLLKCQSCIMKSKHKLLRGTSSPGISLNNQCF